MKPILVVAMAAALVCAAGLFTGASAQCTDCQSDAAGAPCAQAGAPCTHGCGIGCRHGCGIGCGVGCGHGCGCGIGCGILGRRHAAAASSRAASEANGWHGNYYHVSYGMPVALVVPPRASLQTQWGWGVGSTQVTGIYPQFNHNYPGPGYYAPGMFAPTPVPPSHTNQFGVYYVRGPW